METSVKGTGISLKSSHWPNLAQMSIKINNDRLKSMSFSLRKYINEYIIKGGVKKQFPKVKYQIVYVEEW